MQKDLNKIFKKYLWISFFTEIVDLLVRTENFPKK